MCSFICCGGLFCWLFIRCLGFGFDAFSFNSFNLFLDVISSPYFPSVRVRLFVFEDEGGGISYWRNRSVTIERTAVEGLDSTGLLFCSARLNWSGWKPPGAGAKFGIWTY